MITYHDFLNRVIDDGIKAARADYTREDQKMELNGSVAGFEACRDKDPALLGLLMEQSIERTHHARINQSPDYWYHRCYELEVEWVCNVVSAMIVNEFKVDSPWYNLPTSRG